jgi:hypothetical protein
MKGIIPSLNSVLIDITVPELTEESIHNPSENETIPINNHTSIVKQCIINDNHTNNQTHLAHFVMPFKLFIYDILYAVSVILITLLYALIYKEIRARKKIKMKRKQELLSDFSDGLIDQRDLFLNESLLVKNLNNSIKQPNSLAKKSNHESNDMSNMNTQNRSNDIPMNELKKSSSCTKLNEKSIIKMNINGGTLYSKKQNESDSPNTKSCVKTKTQRNFNNNNLRKNQTSTSFLSKSFKKKNPRHNKRAISLFKRESTFNSKIIPFLVLIRETRTAFMLFVVSIVFIAFYLPSILATRSILPNDNLFIVYLYFTNSAINPIIYSFINRSFRADLKKRICKIAKCLHLYPFDCTKQEETNRSVKTSYFVADVKSIV